MIVRSFTIAVLVAALSFLGLSAASAHPHHHHHHWRFTGVHQHHRHFAGHGARRYVVGHRAVSFAQFSEALAHATPIIHIQSDERVIDVGGHEIDQASGGSEIFSDLGNAGSDVLTFAGRVATPLSPSLVASYIADAARERGLNPRWAVHVAATEGLTDYIGDGGTSFGPFQLHYAPYWHRPALGDRFTAATGLNARDPSTWRQQVDFSLDWARVHGWANDWFGWRRYGWHHRWARL